VNVAVAHLRLVDETEVDDVDPDLGIDDVAKGREDLAARAQRRLE
jgi:hypothetical protein